MARSSVMYTVLYKMLFNIIMVSFCLTAKKINYLFPIQSETFDYIYDGHDLIAQASKFILLSQNWYTIQTVQKYWSNKHV